MMILESMNKATRERCKKEKEETDRWLLEMWT
jgi:hypothetical protein